MVIIKFNLINLIPKNFSGVDYFYDYNRKVVKLFRNNKKIHRYYGPAIIYCDNKRWFFNHNTYGSAIENYNQKQFIKDINKLWLL